MLLHANFGRYDMTRGISPLTSALNSFRDTYEAFDYALAKSKINQLFGLAFKRDGGEQLGELGFGDAEEEDETDETDETDAANEPRYNVDISQGSPVLDLDPGDSVDILESKTPSTEFQQFMTMTIMAALKSLDIPFCFYNEAHTHYSGSRQAWLQYEHAAVDKRLNLQEFLEEAVRWRLAVAALSGDLMLPRKTSVADLPLRFIPLGVPIDYCHDSSEVLGALGTFDTESGDLQCTGFVDRDDQRAAEVVRKVKMGVPYEASIFFDRRTIEGERLSDRETATVNGVTVRGPVTIIRKWTLRGVAICPYGYDPKTSTRFSEDDCDVDVTLLSSDPDSGDESMSNTPQAAETGELSEQTGGEPQTAESQAASRQMAGMFGRFLVSMSKIGRTGEDEPPESELGAGSPSEKPAEKPAEKPGELSDDSGEETPANPPETSTELGAGGDVEKPSDKKAPGQAFIERFGLEKGAVFFAQGLSMDQATAEHNKALEKKVEELSARIDGANLGSEEPVSFSGEGAGTNDEQSKGTGDSALDAFCANTKLPGRS